MGRKGRRETFNPLEVSVQHCIGRVVRRAWLLGDDPYTGKNFDHRKDWVKNRLVHLAAQLWDRFARLCDHEQPICISSFAIGPTL